MRKQKKFFWGKSFFYGPFGIGSKKPVTGLGGLSFVVGNQTPPAGEYTIEQDRGQGSAILRSGKGSAIMLLAAKSDRAFEEKSYVLFRRNGTHYFLARYGDKAKGRYSLPVIWSVN